MSGLNTTARARVLALGASDFIAKPFDLNMLVTEIKLFLAEQQADQEDLPG
jgi:DNA-binding response OmpR family regulator